LAAGPYEFLVFALTCLVVNGLGLYSFFLGRGQRREQPRGLRARDGGGVEVAHVALAKPPNGAPVPVPAAQLGARATPPPLPTPFASWHTFDAGAGSTEQHQQQGCIVSNNYLTKLNHPSNFVVL
jgi:hypothetical protein